jgi:pyrroline-5-carboxylate reductase
MRVFGVLGTGQIGGALTAGLAARLEPDESIVLSPHSRQRATELAAGFDRVRIAADNQAVVDEAEIVVIALRAEAADDVQRQLRFRPDQLVISLAATTAFARLTESVRPARVARAVPLPSIRDGIGPTVVFPEVEGAEILFGRLGGVVWAKTETNFHAATALTALIRPLQEIGVMAASWGVQRGLTQEDARQLVSPVFEFIAMSITTGGTAPVTEATTPGGLNAQTAALLARLGTIDHFREALDAVMDRLQRASE